MAAALYDAEVGHMLGQHGAIMGHRQGTGSRQRQREARGASSALELGQLTLSRPQGQASWAVQETADDHGPRTSQSTSVRAHSWRPGDQAPTKPATCTLQARYLMSSRVCLPLGRAENQ